MAVSFFGDLFAYIGPGTGLEYIPQLLALLALAGTALLGVLLWPVYALLGLFRKAKDGPEHEPAEEAKNEPATAAAPAAPADAPTDALTEANPAKADTLNNGQATAAVSETRGESAPTSS